MESKIRRILNGELLFKLSETGLKSAEFRRTIVEALGVQAEVRTLTHRITIECKDIDEISAKEVIVAAISSKFEVYCGTQTEALVLPAESAKKFLKAGKIKIDNVATDANR